MMQGRDWKCLDEVEMVDCVMEVKRLRNLYYDADFNDDTELALFYKSKMNHFQSMVDNGVEYQPNF
jgi:hypothetical protein|tara:strand:- start:1411 stop:1608 length:198 start_codon:yes stop_codon:yes gene_type:complete